MKKKDFRSGKNTLRICLETFLKSQINRLKKNYQWPSRYQIEHFMEYERYAIVKTIESRKAENVDEINTEV